MRRMKHLARRTMAVALLLLTACATALPRAGKPALPDIQFRMRDFRMANGLRILVEEDHGSPLVGVFTCVGVGSAGDPEGREGLAHLVEHLMFRNKADGRNTMWDRIGASGIGTFNAFTNFDETLYYDVGSKDILDKMLQIEGGRLSSPLAGIDEAVFNVEREVVRNELRQRGETQVGPALPWLQELVFPKGSPWARPIGGSHESLSAVTLADARAFVADKYKPSNMTMLIVGDVDLATIQQQLAMNLPSSLFQPTAASGPVPSRIPGEAKAPPEPPAQTGLLKKRATVATPELYVAWSLPRGFGDDGVVQDFVRTAASASLQQAWLSDPDIVSVGIEVVPGVEGSLMIARAVLRKAAHPEKSLAHLLDNVVLVWAGDAIEGVSSESMVSDDRRFAFQRNAAVMGMTLEAENIAARGVERVLAAHFTGDPLVYGRRLKELAKVGPGQVAHFAEQYLKRERARAVLVEPLAADAKEQAPAAVGLGGAVATENTTSAVGPSAVLALGKSRTAGRNETVVRGSKNRADETWPNGLRVIVQRRHGLPVAVVEVAFPVGGASATPKGAAMLGDFLAEPHGHRYGSGRDFGIQWSSVSTADLTNFTARGANGNVPNMLAQLSEMVSGMVVEPHSLAAFQGEYLDYQASLEELPQAKADRALKTALYGTHPFGETPRASELKAIGATDISKWLEKVMSPQGAVLVIAGDVDVDLTMAEAKKWLGAWQGPAQAVAKVPVVTLRQDPKPQVQVTHRPGATQAELHMACLARAETSKQDLTNAVIAELLGDTLFRKVRGELGATYGISGRAVSLLGGSGQLEWRGALENGRLGDALKVIKKTWDELDSTGFNDKDVGRARWQRAREATLNTITSETMSTLLSHALLQGRNPEDIDRVFEELAGINADDLHRAWADCRGHAVISLVGDEATIQAAVKSAGL